MSKPNLLRFIVLIFIAAFALHSYIGSWDKRAFVKVSEPQLQNEPLNVEFIDEVCRLSAESDIKRLGQIFGSEYSRNQRSLLVSYKWSENYWQAHANYTKGMVINVGYYHKVISPEKLLKPRLLGEVVFPIGKTSFGDVIEKWGQGYPLGVIWKSDQDDSSINMESERSGNGTCHVYYGFFPKQKDRMEIMVFQDGVLVKIYN